MRMPGNAPCVAVNAAPLGYARAESFTLKSAACSFSFSCLCPISWGEVAAMQPLFFKSVHATFESEL